MSALDTAIAAARATIDQAESPYRRALRDAYRRAVDSLNDDLASVTRMIGDARAAGVDVSPDWLRRQARYRRLIDRAEAEFDRFSREGMYIVRQARMAAVSGGAIEAWEMMDAAGVTTGFESNINRQAVERTAAALQDGPVREVLDGYGTQASTFIGDTLVQGVIEGAGPREIVRFIRRHLTSGLTRARLDALVRTEMMRAYRGSLFDQFAAMGLERWRWVAAHSTRTCLACLSRSGKTYPMKDAFLQAHVNCRCIPSPVVDGITPETGEEWFARQGLDRQRLMMPSRDVFDAYRAGLVGLDDFAGVKRSRRWGSSIYERSGRDVLLRRAGIRRDEPTQYQTPDAVLRAEDVIRKGKIETAIIFDTEGNEIFRKRGGARSVSFNQSDMDRMQGAILTHNHPSQHRYSDFLAPQDILMVRQGGLQEMRAVSQSYTMVMRRTPDTLPNAKANWLKTDVNRIEGQVKRELQEQAQAGVITYEQANLMYYEEVAQRLAKAWGLEYERIPR